MFRRTIREEPHPSVMKSRVTSCYFSLSGRQVLSSLVLLRIILPLGHPVLCILVLLLPRRSPSVQVLCSLVLLLPRRPPSVPVLCSLVLLLPLRTSSVAESRVTSTSQADPLTTINRSATPRVTGTSECAPDNS